MNVVKDSHMCCLLFFFPAKISKSNNPCSFFLCQFLHSLNLFLICYPKYYLLAMHQKFHFVICEGLKMHFCCAFQRETVFCLFWWLPTTMITYFSMYCDWWHLDVEPNLSGSNLFGVVSDDTLCVSDVTFCVNDFAFWLDDIILCVNSVTVWMNNNSLWMNEVID